MQRYGVMTGGLCYRGSHFLPVIDDPRKVICVGMNYADKRIEFNETNRPQPFVRFADSRSRHNIAAEA